MSLIERDIHRPHPQTLGRIAGALELSVSDLRAELEGAERPFAQAPPETAPQREGTRLHGVVSEETRRTPESMTVTRAGMAHPLDEILDDLEHGRVEEAKSKLRELVLA
jgi:hypothetical protein